MNLLAPLYCLADHLRYRVHRNSGRRAEDMAHRYLRRRGFTIAARNWRPPQGGGEIDIIGWDHGALVFIEVKYRSSGTWSAPERAIDPLKIQALRRAARDYVRRAAVESAPARFDVICITGADIEYLPEAFSICPEQR